MMKYDRYRKFRQQTYQMLGKAKDATFELMDSVMTTRNASCLAEFSLSPLFRRKWSSTYEALQDSRSNRNKLMKRYIEEIPSSEYLLLGIDHTAWGRSAWGMARLPRHIQPRKKRCKNSQRQNL